MGIGVREGFDVGASIDVSFATLVESLGEEPVALGRQWGDVTYQ